MTRAIVGSLLFKLYDHHNVTDGWVDTIIAITALSRADVRKMCILNFINISHHAYHVDDI